MQCSKVEEQSAVTLETRATCLDNDRERKVLDVLWADEKEMLGGSWAVNQVSSSSTKIGGSVRCCLAKARRGANWVKSGVYICIRRRGAGLVSRWQEGAYSSSRRMAFRCCENHWRNTFWIRSWMFGLWAFAVWAAKWMKDRSTNPELNRHVMQTPDVFERLMQKEGIKD